MPVSFRNPLRLAAVATRTHDAVRPSLRFEKVDSRLFIREVLKKLKNA